MKKDIEYYKNLEKNIKKPKRIKKIKEKIIEKACYKCTFYIDTKNVYEAKKMFNKKQVDCFVNGLTENKICDRYEVKKCTN